MKIYSIIFARNNANHTLKNQMDMTPEEQRNQLKEQYKQELRERKAFLEKVNKLKQQQNLLKAIEGLNPQDDTADWVEKLNQETAFMEAKTEIALNMEEEKRQELERLEKKVDLEKLAAEQLILEMKRQMGMLTEEPPKKEESPSPQPEEKTQTPPPNILGDF